MFSGNETATTASFYFISLFFVLMLTDNLLLSGVVGGLIFGFSRIVDAFTDPLIGTWIDKTTTRFGRYRPFIVGGSLIINISVLAIFGGFVRLQPAFWMYVWIIFWYILYIIGYTFQSACTRSAQTILTNDPLQRPILGALLAGFSYIFYGLFLIYALQYVESFPGGFANSLGYRNLALIVVAINVVLTILAVMGLRESDVGDTYAKLPPTSRVKWKSIFTMIGHNRPLRSLIVAAGTNKFAQLATSTSMAYFFMYTVRNTALQPVVARYGLIAGVVGVVIGVIAAKIVDRKFSFLFGTYLGLLFPILIMVFHPFSGETEWLLVFFLVAIIAATAIASTNVLPLIADVADYEYYINKQYIPSTVGTTFSLVDKLISSLSGIILAGALAFSGYVPNMPPNDRAFWAFYVMVIVIPALGHVASIAAFIFYPIDKKYYQEMLSRDPR